MTVNGGHGTVETVTRDANGRFTVGNKAALGSAGGGSRPGKKRLPKVTEIESVLPLTEREQFIKDQFELAQSGESPAMAAFFMDRFMPAHKPTLPPVQLPDDIDHSDPISVISGVLKAIGAGNIPPDVGKELIGAIQSLVETATQLQLGPQLVEMQESLAKMLESKGR